MKKPSGTTRNTIKSKHDHCVQREVVVKFVMEWFMEPRELATLRVRRKPWGYEINPQPIHSITGEFPDLILYGPGPTLVHGETGVILSLSSSPGDMLGPVGFNSLKSMENLDVMIEARGIPASQNIYALLETNQEDV